MLPAWTGVVSAISLAIVALAALAVAASTVGIALGLRAALKMLEGKATPALDDLRQIVTTVRGEVDALVAMSSRVRERVAGGSDAVAARLAELNALVDVVQEDVR